MRAEVQAPDVQVTPGRDTTITVEVANTSSVIDGVSARLEGVDASWVHLPTPVLTLFPDSTGVLPIQIRFPHEAKVGEYLVVVHVESTIDATRREQHELWLQVPPLEAAQLELRPSVVTKGASATVSAIVTNTGNVDTDFMMGATDQSRAVDCAAAPLTLTVPAGESAAADISMHGPRPWFAQTAVRNLTVSASAATVELAASLTFNQKPRIPRGALTIGLLAAIVALWATVLLVGVEVFRGSDDPSKAVSPNFNEGGSQNVPLLAVAASVSGSATAQSTGGGIERVTVEAFRLNRDGDSELTASAATDEQGTYQLAPLLPGTYTLRFTAEGYDERWYPDAATGADAEELSLEPTAELDAINVELGGESGALSGEFLLPDSAQDGQSITVTVTQVSERSADADDDAGDAAGDEDDGGGAGETPTAAAPIVEETTGSLTLTDLVTPAQYRIRAEAEGYQPVEVETELVGGETKVLDTVRLSSADGTIAGRVVTLGGTPLGNVDIMITSGDIEKSATTATTGNVGAFRVDGLDAPRTYVLTFAHDTYGSQTSALDLGPGELRDGVDVVLTGGTATITGQATGAGGAPLGDVTVTVAGGDFGASTATLTSAGADAPVGGYRVTEVPAPGSYSVTFAADGYMSETLIVDITDPGVQSGVSATLRASHATVTGQVRGPGGVIADAEVELSDGETTLVTATASSPAGGFRFSNVPPGSYTLTVDAPGHHRRIVLVTVTAGQTLERAITLRRPG